LCETAGGRHERHVDAPVIERAGPSRLDLQDAAIGVDVGRGEGEWIDEGARTRHGPRDVAAPSPGGEESQ
jgi:hypothetical protein